MSNPLEGQAHRGHTHGFALLASFFVLSAGLFAGCATGWGWGSGLAEEALDLPATPNGLVVAVGPNGFSMASAQLTGALRDDYSDGVLLTGDREAVDPVEPDLSLDWAGDAQLVAATVSASAAGPRLEVALNGLRVDATVVVPGAPGCSMVLSAPDALVSAGVSITVAKSGALQASVLSDVAWAGEAPSVETSGCDLVAGLSDATDLLASLREELLNGAAANVLSTLAPTIDAVLPRLLGVDLGSRVAMAVDDAEATFEVRGPDGPSSKPWSFADDQLFVFFTVGSGGRRHDCVPPADPPAAISLPVPALDGNSSATLMVNESALVRGLHLAWAAGRVCADRGTRGLELVVDDLESAWPEMAELEAERITARLWPQGDLTVESLDGLDGTAELLISTDALRVELYATVDDTRVLATAFTLGLSVVGPLLIADDGSVWLDAAGISVTSATEVTKGLVVPPSNIAAALGQPLAATVLGGYPVWQLPELPGASSEVLVRRDNGYLVFWHPAVETFE